MQNITSFGGRVPRPPAGALPLNPNGDFHPSDSLTNPPPVHKYWFRPWGPCPLLPFSLTFRCLATPFYTDVLQAAANMSRRTRKLLFTIWSPYIFWGPCSSEHPEHSYKVGPGSNELYLMPPMVIPKSDILRMNAEDREQRHSLLCAHNICHGNFHISNDA